jgi:NAD(P)H-hydrate epimerase
MPKSEPIRLTRAQVREIDRRAIEEYHIPGIVLMENAAIGAAAIARKMKQGNPEPSAVIVCGGGNNGGDGLAVARHLHNAGWSIDIVIATHSYYSGDALINFDIAEQMKLSMICLKDAEDVINPHAQDFLVDALFGTGLTSPPKDHQRAIIELMNATALPILAIDLPSGMDCDTGRPLGDACVRATRTVTFVAEKVGFANPASKEYTGEITVVDIGCPRELLEEVESTPRD